MTLPWKRALAAGVFAFALPRCEVPPAPEPSPDAVAFEAPPPTFDVPSYPETGPAWPDRGEGGDRMDAGASADTSTWGVTRDDAPAWLEDAGSAVFDDTPAGQMLSGGPALSNFSLPVEVSALSHLTVGPTGSVWLANVTVERVTSFDGRTASSAITAIDPEGIVLAQHATEGTIGLRWIEADAEGALAALNAIGSVRLGPLSWSSGDEREDVLVRFDRRGAPRWWTRLPGARLIPGARVAGDGATVVVWVERSARLGGERVEGPRHARVDLDERGVVTSALSLGAGSARSGARALPLDDGGAMLAERGEADGTISAYDHRGAPRWSRSGPLEDAVFDVEGNTFVLTGSELIGMDGDGFVRWRTARPGFTSDTFGGYQRTSRGRELRMAGGAIAVLQRMDVVPEWQNENFSPCYPPGPRGEEIEVVHFDRRGPFLDRVSAWWSFGAREVAWNSGRTCTLRRDWPADGRSLATLRTGALSCSGSVSRGACAAGGYCGPCGADLFIDPANCGACGHRCEDLGGTLGRCIRGVCVYDRCDVTHADCDAYRGTGCEVDLSRDPANCGACGNACPAGDICEYGRCAGVGAIWWSTGLEGDFAPTHDTVLPSGIHHFRAITIPAGVTLRTTADGVLDLRGTGDVRILGTIDLSGGDGEGVSPLAAGGSTAGAPRGPAGSRGAGPAGGGGVAEATGAGVAPGGQGPPEPHCVDDRVVGGACWHATVTLDDVLPSYEGDDDVRCLRCPAPGGQARLCEVVPGGSGGGGSIGERAVLDLAVAATFAPGSGGGAGGTGGGGGAGGGALRISSPTRIVLAAGAALLARGGRGGAPNGGPGSGGVVVLAAPEVRAEAGSRVSAAGGGTNGLGRVRVTADSARCTLAGSFVPPLRDGCAPTNAMGFTYVSAWR